MLEVKRIYIRYISHEIRTPLNTIQLGLEFLRRRLTSAVEDQVSVDIVNDLSESCTTAVETLNEILIYDKIETTALQLDKSETVLKPFLRSTFDPFNVQVNNYL